MPFSLQSIFLLEISLKGPPRTTHARTLLQSVRVKIIWRKLSFWKHIIFYFLFTLMALNCFFINIVPKCSRIFLLKLEHFKNKKNVDIFFIFFRFDGPESTFPGVMWVTTKMLCLIGSTRKMLCLIGSTRKTILTFIGYR